MLNFSMLAGTRTVFVVLLRANVLNFSMLAGTRTVFVRST